MGKVYVWMKLISLKMLSEQYGRYGQRHYDWRLTILQGYIFLAYSQQHQSSSGLVQWNVPNNGTVGIITSQRKFYSGQNKKYGSMQQSMDTQ